MQSPMLGTTESAHNKVQGGYRRFAIPDRVSIEELKQEIQDLSGDGRHELVVVHCRAGQEPPRL